MAGHCRKCGAKLKEKGDFCPNCGEKNPTPRKNVINKYTILIIIAIVIMAVAASIFLVGNQTQIVTVDGVKFEIPSSYVNDPSRTDISYDGNVKSSAMGWSNDENYIEIGITRTPGSGINSKEVASQVGGSPTKMFGHDGYYQKYDEESYSFVFGMKDKVCMIYVSDYDAFSDVKVIEEVD
ncbi:MAG: zinc ribbon domain-containing protein [Methanobrevibacter sp.]|uniref:zinc ribbon domain-containing protein n=1 Tax=Methanobrevibacter sp. TaxID=66852 RepID=UPI002E77EA9F|nr:zinc ribbon domain-containing protein [Methanobrevibacter sp.]MEE0936023.1 zinc ribbon domain-containing protein [Methanobrevibacter sp.]